MLGEGVLNVGANTQNVENLWKSHLFNTPHMDIKWSERLMGWNQHFTSWLIDQPVVSKNFNI